MVRRRRKKKSGFLLGTVVGLVAGAAGGTAMLRRAATRDTEIEVRVATVTETAGEAVGVVRQAPVAARQRAQTGLDALRQRWEEAVREGKIAAREREAELQEQFERDTKRIATPPAIEGTVRPPTPPAPPAPPAQPRPDR